MRLDRAPSAQIDPTAGAVEICGGWVFVADLQLCYPIWGRTDKKATAMNENTEDKWITRQELADRYGVPVKTPAEWASKGTGPRYAKIGRHVRYLLSDVIDWERRQFAEDKRHPA
jgi:predicted DNA-binding transcriptional regulator AlpA